MSTAYALVKEDRRLQVAAVAVGSLILVVVASAVGFEVPAAVVLLGAIRGTGYALMGIGLVLIYQTTRVINFAQGAVGGLASLLVAVLVIDHGWNYWLALLLALAVAVAAGAAIDLVVIRRLRSAPRLVVLVATIGIAQLLLVPTVFIVDLQSTRLGLETYPVPFSFDVKLGNQVFGTGELLSLVAVPLVTIGLTLFLRRTSLGLASRGAAENTEAAELAGVPVTRVSMTMWSIAGLLAGVGAVLIAPTQPILGTVFSGGPTANSSTNLIRGLGAAMMGGLSSLPQVFVAGMGLAVVETLVRWNYPTGGASNLVVVAMILISLFLRRDLRQLARGGEESSWSLAGSMRELPERVRRHPRVRAAGAGVGIVAGLIVFVLLVVEDSPSFVFYSSVLLFMVIAASLVMLTGWAGQVTLGHFTFVGIGALMGGRMAQLGYPPFGALLIAVAFSAVAALVVGLPALRVRGLFLAVTTLAFAVTVNGWLVNQSWFVNVSSSGSSLRLLRPTVFGYNTQDSRYFFVMILPLAVAALAMMRRLRATGVYRSLSAVRDNEPAAAAMSLSPARIKLIAFVVSGAMASAAGYFYGNLLVSMDVPSLTEPLVSLDLVIMAIVGGATTITGAVLGALFIRGVPYFIDSTWLVAFTQSAGLLFVILALPGGLAQLSFRVRDWFIERILGVSILGEDASQEDVRPMMLESAPRPPSVGPGGEVALEAKDISVHFGGLIALDQVSLHANRGEIVGLIGPNGAGKTTLFDVLNGLRPPTAGRVFLHGEDVTDLRPEQRAVLGMGRSFQQARLYEDLSTLDVLKVALERQEPSELVPSMLGLPPSRAAERRKHERAREIIDLVGLGPVAETKAGELSTGTRRIVELACVIALDADVVLLDEPTGGIAQAEAEAMVPVLRQIRDYLDATFVVVSHDVPLMMNLVDRMYVLSSGRVIATGDPEVVRHDPAVLTAYIGVEGGRGSSAAEPGSTTSRRAEVVSQP